MLGADIVAPSCMMDGHVTAIKLSLMSKNLLSRVSVLSYSAKFCSVFYGPFRDAANCAPSFSNRSSYQIPVGSSSIAERVVVSIKNGIFTPSFGVRMSFQRVEQILTIFAVKYILQ